MENAQKKVESILEEEGNSKERKKTMSKTPESIFNTLSDELIIGVCSPIGSKKEPFIDLLEDKLKSDFNYEVIRIKLSALIDETDISETDKNREDESFFKSDNHNKNIYQRYYNKIQLGNIVRKYRGNGFLAEKAIERIYNDRVNEAKKKYIKKISENNSNKVLSLDKDAKIKSLEDKANLELKEERIDIDQAKKEFKPLPTDFESRRVCYIVDSLKTKEELKIFSSIYSENFYLISIFSSLSERKSNLKRKGFSEEDIVRIINLDDKQKEKYGQNVRDVFVEGDLFIRSSEVTKLDFDRKVSRFLDLIFETNIVTPTIEETAMYNAKAAAGNSACMSRQVGACIIDENNNILSVGWNDVPKFGGNLYFSDFKKDHRCFNHGFCSNDEQKDNLVNNIIETLFNNEKVKDKLDSIEGLKEKLLQDIRKNSKVKDLIEFSRSVHAEMHAIIQGALLTGDKLLSSRLFCTTYPCHNCARHIVAAGIKEVYYIEPYVKSLCLTLHEDAMTDNEEISGKVKILIFDGISPKRYLSFFTNFAERKQNGKFIKKEKKSASLKTRKSLQALSTLEAQAVHSNNS
ncbi:MAG: hypothetical protein LBE34_11440 [Flavobacteriaceae bacterium]|jgi:deoxycytidylate deaminase|nr:hypothetical protein [Flavobacteriaceae bacterium]